MSDHTPSLDEAKGHYAASRVLTPQTYRRAEAEFDRMIDQERADTLKGLLSEFGEWADEMTFVVGNELDEDAWRDVTVREYITQCIDEIEREAGL